MPVLDPLILAAAFDPASFARFDALRRRHFPPALNRIPAHLTLFHHLPGEALDTIGSALTAACDRPPVPFATAGVRNLGRGVAIEIKAPDLVTIRRALAAKWDDRLTAQDRQGFRPHVTVQNKVAPATARALLDELGTLEPWTGTLVGLDLWFYRGGPWEKAGAWRMTGADRIDVPGDEP